MNSVAVKNLLKKYNVFENDVIPVEIERMFQVSKNSTCTINLSLCVQFTKKYPRLNDFLKEYLNTCSDVNIDKIDKSGSSALHYACCYSRDYGSAETIKLLINAGSNVNLQNNAGYTALYFAVKHLNNLSSEEAVKILIQADADVFNLRDISGKTPYDYFSNKLLELFQIDKDTQTIGIKTGKLTKSAVTSLKNEY